MSSKFFTSILTSVALIGSATLALAADAPDFAAIAEQMTNSAPAAAPVVKDIDFSKVKSDTYAYVASIERQVDQASMPFTKLAQQFIWGSDRLHKSDDSAPKANATVSANRPYIYVAGYWNTQISYTNGGTITLLAYVQSPLGPTTTKISKVELYENQLPLGIYLYDDGQHGDFAAGDSVYGLQYTFGPQQFPAGQYLFELVATDVEGNASDMWPYLTIN